MDIFLQLPIMDALAGSPSLLLGLMGWAATVSLLNESKRLAVWQRRTMIIFTWMLWMIPAFDATVYQGLLSTEAAILYCGTLTMAIVLFISLTALRRHTRQ
jgi:hypothetical protein